MKKISFFIVMGLAVYALQACHSTSTTTTQTDSSTQTKDSTAKVGVTDTGRSDTADVKFAKTLAAGGAAEIKFSKLAQQTTKNAKLKDYANMMVTDHTKAADTLMAIAQKESITLPSGMDADHQSKYNDMSKLTGDDFDKAYINLMVNDHQGAVTLITAESQNGQDAALKAFATKILPTIQMHLDAIKKIQTGTK